MRQIDQRRLDFETNSSVDNLGAAHQARALAIPRRRLHPIEVSSADSGRANVVRFDLGKGAARQQPQFANRVGAGEVGAGILLRETTGLRFGHRLLPRAARGDAIENVIAGSVENARERNDATGVGMEWGWELTKACTASSAGTAPPTAAE